MDDGSYTDAMPIYRLVLTGYERQVFQNLNNNSDAEMNATLITSDGAATKLRYNVGMRIRGAGSRGRNPKNLRVNIPRDRLWNGISEMNLNVNFIHLQLAGSVLALKSGLPVAAARVLQVRLNGSNLAYSGNPQNGSGQGSGFGSYVFVEPIGGEWAALHFPDDPSGNVYRASRAPWTANLDYQGTDPFTYQNLGYSKTSNQSDNDWTDLIELTYALSPNTSDASYVQTVQQHANVELWMRYFAFCNYINYNETALCNGVGDDYGLYRGMNDPRFVIITHDFDTILGMGDGDRLQNTSTSIWRPVDSPRSSDTSQRANFLSRFMRHNEFAPLYFQEYQRLLDTTFVPDRFNEEIDRLLGGWVPNTTIQEIKDFNVNRRAYVVTQIPTNYSLTIPLSQSAGIYSTTSPSVNLSGNGNVLQTRSVYVNGVPATWTAWNGTWSASNFPLLPGINHLIVQWRGANGEEVHREEAGVWYDDGSVDTVPTTIATDRTLTAAGGPYRITSDVTVPSGVTLTVEPGTTLYFGQGARLIVNGILSAQGTEAHHLRMTREPGGSNWGSLDFLNTTEESRLAYVDFSYCGGTSIGGHNAQLHVNDAMVFIDHCTWPSTPVVEYISFDYSSFIVQNCIFPSYPPPSGPESLHGVNGIPVDGYGIFRDNYFGHTWGFNDTIDFTGGQRPGAILQLIHNVFDGASDDHLDLDSTDAWIEGNVFLHAHRDPNRTDNALDTASAISGGVDNAGQYSDWTIINNVFFDVDHVFLNKGPNGGGRVAFLYNTVVHVAKEYSGSTVAEIGAFNWSDDNVAPAPVSAGSGLYAAYNIMYDCAVLNVNYVPANYTIIMDHNILSVPWTGAGTNNQVIDPRLNLAALAGIAYTNATADQVLAACQLLAGSPAIGAGFGGRDLGGLNPYGIAVDGEPDGVSDSTSATLTVGPGGTFDWGSTTPQPWGWTAFRWKLDNGLWSSEIPVTNNSPFTNPATISLTGLNAGAHTVYVAGRNDAGLGYYQDDPFVYPETAGVSAHVTASRTWVVNPAATGIRINEVLARNDRAVRVGDKYPDLVELYNSSSATVDLKGLSLTDDKSNPDKFTFPPGAVIGSNKYLVLYADSDNTPGLHLGFGLNQDGDDLYLFSGQGQLLDSVTFGLQIADRSIGRLAGGAWGLASPTFGAANVAAQFAASDALLINEWLAAGVSPVTEDFIELYNPASLPVALGGLYFTDVPETVQNLKKIAPLSYISGHGLSLFIADGNGSAGANHVNFRLAAEQGFIGLFAPDLSLIDCIYYGPQTNNISQGRSPNGSTEHCLLCHAYSGLTQSSPLVRRGHPDCDQ